jgi:adenosylhomocysteine nucleosidase
MIGVVTGLRAEARCLRGLDVAVACSGARPARARAEAARLIAEGAAGLVSFGLAGGLSPALASGDLVLADAVVLPGGGRIATDLAWRNRISARVEVAGRAPRQATVAGSDRLLATVAAKRALFEATGALAVDMESHAVAEAAHRAGLPFVVLRAIADPADQALPRAAMTALGASGEVRLLTVARALLERPGELPALLRLGRQSRRVLATLHQVVRGAGSSLEHPFSRPRPAGNSGS